MDEPLTETELKELLRKLNRKPSELVRRNEGLYLEEYLNKELTENEWLQILVQHPGLIERPIVEKGDIAIIARPPEKVFELAGNA